MMSAAVTCHCRVHCKGQLILCALVQYDNVLRNARLLDALRDTIATQRTRAERPMEL